MTKAKTISWTIWLMLAMSVGFMAFSLVSAAKAKEETCSPVSHTD